MRVILREGDYYTPFTSYITYRWMPTDQFESVPFYLYENKLAIIQDKQGDLEIFIINSPSIASTFKKQFDFMWGRCKEIPRQKARLKN
jgi:hypothetical protein